eukprot:3070603-Amphidinium_carterae.2
MRTIRPLSIWSLSSLAIALFRGGTTGARWPVSAPSQSDYHERRKTRQRTLGMGVPLVVPTSVELDYFFEPFSSSLFLSSRSGNVLASMAIS